jgi:hypothetical protein
VAAGKREDLRLLAAARMSLDPGDAMGILRKRVDASAHVGQGGRLRDASAGPNCGRRAENEQESDDDEQTPGHVTIIARQRSYTKRAIRRRLKNLASLRPSV